MTFDEQRGKGFVTNMTLCQQVSTSVYNKGTTEHILTHILTHSCTSWFGSGRSYRTDSSKGLIKTARVLISQSCWSPSPVPGGDLPAELHRTVFVIQDTPVFCFLLLLLNFPLLISFKLQPIYYIIIIDYFFCTFRTW